MERRYQAKFQTEASYPTVYDREQTLNEIINVCNELKHEYISSGVTPLAKAWEKVLTDLHLPRFKMFQVADLQERRVVDLFEKPFPHDHIEEFTTIGPSTINV